MAAISLAPEILFSAGNLKISNSIVATIVVDLFLVLFVFLVNKNMRAVPKFLQSIAELLIDTFYEMTEQIAGKYTDKIFPWFASFFIFIFTTNILGLLPGFGTIGFFRIEEGKHVFLPLLRPGTSDFNTTLALAVISLVVTHVMSIRENGVVAYIKKFVSINPILLFVGVLELISEFTKIVSLSFRLFGNIYAGEVVIHTINSLFAFVAPIPFLLLEVIVAFVQALVFSMLTMVFMTILVTPHSEGGEH